MTLKRLALKIAGLAVLLGVVVFGISWYYSTQIEDGVLRVKHDPPTYEVEVVELEEDRVKLRFPTEEDLRKEPEKMGIEWPDGYARVGETINVDGAEALRKYTLLDGELVVGEEVRFDKFAYPGDPIRAHDITFEEIQFASPLGELAARRVAWRSSQGPGTVLALSWGNLCTLGGRGALGPELEWEGCR